MILAGHETTAGSVAWTLYALAKHPEIQTRLREEIKQVQNRVQARGDIEFTAADYEEMPYTVAIMKVGSSHDSICIIAEVLFRRAYDSIQ